MSFKQKGALVTLAVLVLVYGGYFARFIGGVMDAGASPDMRAIDGALIGTVVSLIVLLIFAHILLTVLNRMAGGDEREDERDRWIGALGERNGGFVVGFGAVTAMLALLAETDPVVVVHVLLGALVLGEVVTQASKLIYYGRGV